MTRNNKVIISIIYCSCHLPIETIQQEVYGVKIIEL